MDTTPAALRPYVASIAAYAAVAGAPGVHRGLPGTTCTLVLPVDEPLEVSWAGVPGSRRRGWSCVAGLHARPAAIHHPGRQSGVQVALTLAGARALLGVPAAALTGQLVSLDELDGLRRAAPELAALPERLAATPVLERVPVVSRALAAALGRREGAHDARPRAEVDRALALLSRGSPVAAVADEVGYSRRRLSTLVGEECGLTPKGYQRVARFERSRAVVGRRPLAEVAAGCGYADQGHLAREWAELAGCSPTTWVREELGYLEAAEGGGDSR